MTVSNPGAGGSNRWGSVRWMKKQCPWNKQTLHSNLDLWIQHRPTGPECVSAVTCRRRDETPRDAAEGPPRPPHEPQCSGRQGARPDARRLKRLERRTRVKVERTVRALEPKVRQAVAEAAVIARGVRAGVRAGVAAYREGRSRKR
jgi:hypothetical protein